MAEKVFKRTLVTSALPYANGDIHLGHLAGAYLPADMYVRYLRLRGEDVLYICGSDEYGVPITLTAEKLGITPKELVDRNHAAIRDSFAGFGMSFDNFSQTSRAIHTETSQEFFRDMHAQGLFVQTQQRLPPLTAIELALEVAGQDDPIRLSGMVVYNLPGDPERLEPAGLGLHLDGGEDEGMARLHALAERLLEAWGRYP